MNLENVTYENELIVPITNLPANPHDDLFEEVIKTSQFLPRIQLYGGNSGPVKKMLIPMAHYGLVRSSDNIEDLGSEVDFAPLAYRFKAMEIADGEVTTYHDPKHAEFIRIQSQADVKDSGCMFGVEFILWLGEKQEFVSYFMNSKSARRVAPTVKGLIGQLGTLKVELVETKKFSWHAPVVTICSTPFNLPAEDDMVKEVDKFQNPPVNTDEVATDGEKAASERAR